MQNLIASLLAKLGAVSPFAKAVVPSVAGLVGALLNMALSGSFNATSIGSLAGGVVTAIIVYLTPNKPKPAPVPSPAKAARKRAGQ